MPGNVMLTSSRVVYMSEVAMAPSQIDPVNCFRICATLTLLYDAG